MILAQSIALAVEKLKAAGVGSPQFDARLLFGHALGLDRAQLLSEARRVLDEKEISSVGTLLARRMRHESVARIIGSREFWGLDFGLNEATLEPRPDSETVIEAVLKKAATLHTMRRILDLGTGTGCLLLSLLHEWPDASGLGIDYAPRAIEQAMYNAEMLKLGARAEFLRGDWLDGIVGQFDIIVSNPPYIAACSIHALMPEVRDYDPALALDGGDDGLAPYRLLIPQLAHFLKPRGFAAFEVGQGQAQQVMDLFEASGFSDITGYKDLGEVTRCVTAALPD